MELRHNTLNLKKQLGESETTRVALESEKLRLSLQNITSPRAAPHVTLRELPSAPTHQSSPVIPARDPRQDIASAQKDISEVSVPGCLDLLESANELPQLAMLT